MRSNPPRYGYNLSVLQNAIKRKSDADILEWTVSNKGTTREEHTLVVEYQFNPEIAHFQVCINVIENHRDSYRPHFVEFNSWYYDRAIRTIVFFREYSSMCLLKLFGLEVWCLFHHTVATGKSYNGFPLRSSQSLSCTSSEPSLEMGIL